MNADELLAGADQAASAARSKFVQAQLDALNAINIAAQRQLAAAQADLAAAQRQVASLQVALTTTQTQLATAQADLAAALIRIRELEAQITPPVQEPTLPQITPLVSMAIRKSLGSCAHPTYSTSVYGNREAWISRLADMGMYYFRGMYSADASSNVTVALCRKYNLKWLALLVPENGITPTELTRRINHLAVNAADVVIAVEGVNEPNHNRDGTPVLVTWAQDTVEWQRLLYTGVKARSELAHVKVLGTSLHDVEAANSYAQSATIPNGGAKHWHQVAERGIAQYMDSLGIHRYSNGYQPYSNLDDRLAWIKSAFGNDVKVWVTETGYTNALATTAGHRPITELATSVYGARVILEGARRGVMPAAWYETLDDPDPTNADVESNFGLWAVASSDPATWRAKPVVAEMKKIFDVLDVDGPEYAPDPVGVEVKSVAADMRYIVVGKRDGSVGAFVWRDARVYDPANKRDLTVAPVAVTVTDKTGPRTFQVSGSAWVYVPLTR